MNLDTNFLRNLIYYLSKYELSSIFYLCTFESQISDPTVVDPEEVPKPLGGSERREFPVLVGCESPQTPVDSVKFHTQLGRFKLNVIPICKSILLEVIHYLDLISERFISQRMKM